MLLSHAFVALPIGTIAYRANLFSAVMAAAACALVYAVARQLGARRWTSLCATLGLATGASFWRSAVFAEVYSLAAVMAALAIALLLAWGARGGAGRLLAAIGTVALGLGNHLTIVGLAPACALYVIARDRRVLTVRTVAATALVLFLGVAQYLPPSHFAVRELQGDRRAAVRFDDDLVGRRKCGDDRGRPGRKGFTG